MNKVVTEEDLLIVANPRYQPGHPEEIAQIVVRRALRDDPLGRLHARRQIGAAQYRAGRAWQAAYEAAAIGHVGAIDPSNEPVDGTPQYGGPNLDRVTKAARSLAGWDQLLGATGCAVVRLLLAERLTTAGIAVRFGFGDAEYWGKRFRECLNVLAHDMGYMGRAANVVSMIVARPRARI